MGKKSRRKQITPVKGATSLMEPMEPSHEAKAAIHTLSTFEKLVTSGQIEKALHLESKVLDAIKVRPRDVRPGGTCSIDLSSIYRRLGNLYHFGAGKTKPEGCNTGISYYRKGQELGIVFDATTGLDCFDVEIIECYLDFDRCDEAVEVLKEAVSRLKMNIIMLVPKVAD